MSQTRAQQRFTISEVAADWHEPINYHHSSFPYQTLWQYSYGKPPNEVSNSKGYETSSPAVAERPRDASCLQYQ